MYNSGYDINCALLGFGCHNSYLFPNIYFDVTLGHDRLFNHVKKFSDIKQISLVSKCKYKFKINYNVNLDTNSKIFSVKEVNAGSKRGEYIYDTVGSHFIEYDYHDYNSVTKKVYYNLKTSLYDEKVKYFYGANKLIDSVCKIIIIDGRDTQYVTTFLNRDSIDRIVSIVNRIDARQFGDQIRFRTTEYKIYSEDTSDFFDMKNISRYFPDTIIYADILKHDSFKKMERILEIDTVSKMVTHIVKSPSCLIICNVGLYGNDQEHLTIQRHIDDELNAKYSLDREIFSFPSPRQKISMFIAQPENKSRAYCDMVTFLYGRDLNLIRTTTRVLNYKSKKLLTKYQIDFISKYEFNKKGDETEGKLYHNSCSYTYRIKNGLATGYTEFDTGYGTFLEHLDNLDKFILKIKMKYGF